MGTMVGDYIGTTIDYRDPFPHSLLRTRQKQMKAVEVPNSLALPRHLLQNGILAAPQVMQLRHRSLRLEVSILGSGLWGSESNEALKSLSTLHEYRGLNSYQYYFGGFPMIVTA